MQSVAIRCNSLLGVAPVHFPTATVQHMSCGDFIGSMNGHPYLTGSPSSSWRTTQAAGFCRRRNAVARSRRHCRQRQRLSHAAICTLPGVSGCPWPQWLGISVEAILRRRSARENGMTSVLLVGIAPPLPTTPRSACARRSHGLAATRRLSGPPASLAQIDGVRRCAELIDARGRPVQSDDQPAGRC